jgi:hypothetical protein
MENREYTEFRDIANFEIAAILKGQEILAAVKEELQRNRQSPFEQDFIYREHYGQIPSDPLTTE